MWSLEKGFNMIQGNIRRYKDCRFSRLLMLLQRYIRRQEHKLYRVHYLNDDEAGKVVQTLWVRIPNVIVALKKHEELYYELIYAVGRKHPNETRHQTALRYIQEAERYNRGNEVGVVQIKHTTIV